MTGFHSDNELLARRAGEFEELAGRARRLAEELDRAVREAGRCWGADDIGQEFAAVHEQPARQALDELGAIPARLSGMGSKFAGTAATYQQVDEAGADVLRGLGRTSGGE